MSMLSRSSLLSCALTGSLLLAGNLNYALADVAMSQRVQVRGTVDSLNGNQLTVQSHEGNKIRIQMKQGAMVSGVAKASFNDIKQGDYVGIASLPKSDEGDGALEVLIFPAQLKGVNEGSFSWDLKPGSSMTNATVANTVKSVNNRIVTVTYHGHEKDIAVPEGTPIVTLSPATMNDVKPGAIVFVPAQKGEGNTLIANTLIVGKNGVVPPM
ncbi:hypothetical protein ACWKSK_26060 [Klebsiella pneumoniae]|nr:hypothetical protein [Klebsiella pneumoniae]